MAKPGVGIDCLRFVCEVLQDAEIIPPFTAPFYDPRWGIGRQNNVMERIAHACCATHSVELDEELLFGDILIFNVGNQSNHCAILLDGEVWHVKAKAVVAPEPLDEILPQLQCAIRFLEEGFLRRPETLTREDLAP